MKITPAKLSGFLKEFNFSTKSVLIFGPDENLLSFKITQLLATLAKIEPFKTIHVEAPPASLEDLPIKEQPTLFASDSQKRVFIISGVKDKFLNDLQSIHSQLDESCLLILKGIGLPTSSKIVKFHEMEKGFFCIGVYEQTLAERKSFVQSLITDYNMRIAPQDLNYLTEILSPDPELIRMEIEKLSLFAQKTSQITLSDIKQTIEPEIAEEIDEFIHHVCTGNKAKLLEIYRNLKSDGQEEMIILRSLTNHLARLLQVCASIKQGKELATAIDSLKPRLFFKTKDRFMIHLSKWSPESLYKSLAILKDMEMWLKTNQRNLESYCSRGFLKISSWSR